MNALLMGSVSPDLQSVMNHHAKSFSWAARFLSSSARRDAALLYAFARTADDLADELDLGSPQQRTAALEELRRNALEFVSPDGSLGKKTGCMLRSYGLPNAVLETFMESLQTDADARQIDSTENLLRFAYGVAGTVGQMMRPLLGAPSSGDAHAIALGVAMQLTNIARDVVEDAERGRCYIPSNWGVTLRSMSDPQSGSERAVAFQALQRLLALSDDFYVFARAGLPFIPRHNRRAIRVAAALYQGIGHKILRQGSDRYWQGRTFLTSAEKLKLIGKTLLLPELPAKRQARDVWRTDLAHLVGLPGFPA